MSQPYARPKGIVFTFWILNSLFCRSLGFYQFTMNNYMMVGHVYRNIFNAEHIDCIQQCHNEGRCISYNFERSASGKGTCELNKCGVKDNHEREKCLLYTPGVMYHQIRPSPLINKGDKSHSCWPSPVQIPKECSSYRWLNKTDRSVRYSSHENNNKTDENLDPSWYRFAGGAGTEIATACPPAKRCGAMVTGWLKGKHPSNPYELINSTVCFHNIFFRNCCEMEQIIQIRKCLGFFVYNLTAPSTPSEVGSSVRFCGNQSFTGKPPAECIHYSWLNESDRAQYVAFKEKNDSQLEGSTWYRFGEEAGTEMARACVDVRHCGTINPGWLNSTLPSSAYQVKRSRVCFSATVGCCTFKKTIDVCNCNGFYVYQLTSTDPAKRYCGNGIPSIKGSKEGQTTNQT